MTKTIENEIDELIDAEWQRMRIVATSGDARLSVELNCKRYKADMLAVLHRMLAALYEREGCPQIKERLTKLTHTHAGTLLKLKATENERDELRRERRKAIDNGTRAVKYRLKTDEMKAPITRPASAESITK